MSRCDPQVGCARMPHSIAYGYLLQRYFMILLLLQSPFIGDMIAGTIHKLSLGFIIRKRGKKWEKGSHSCNESSLVCLKFVEQDVSVSPLNSEGRRCSFRQCRSFEIPMLGIWTPDSPEENSAHCLQIYEHTL